MKKCSACGHLNDDNQLFCGQCGSSLETAELVNDPVQNPPSANTNQTTYYNPQQPQGQPIQYQQAPYEKPKKKKKGCLIAILVVLGIFIVFFVAGMIFNGNEADTANNNTSASDTTISKDDFIASCQEYTYTEIARDPENYKGNNAKFKGQVIQVQESGNDVVLRVNITAEENEFADGGYLYEDTIYVEYTKKDENESRILEDDIITIYGTLDGIMTYESIMGEEISIPSVLAEYIEIETD